MLCVNRAAGERVIMRVPNGPVISVIVMRVGSGQRVRLGVEAPDFVAVDREEIDLAKGNELVSQPGKQTETRSMVRLWKAMDEPMHLTNDALIRQAAIRINDLKLELASLKARLNPRAVSAR